MPFILTLITRPETRALDSSMVDAVRRALRQADAPDWLAQGIACDLGCDGASIEAIEAAARDALGTAPVDVVTQEAGETRRRRLIIADMDATMTEGETIDQLAEEAGIGPQIAAITVRAMRGELDFVQALRERTALMAGLPEAALGRVRDRMRPMPGARALVQTMRRHGARTALVSGGFNVFTAQARALIGFDEAHGNTVEVAAGKLTGRVIDPVMGRDAKLRLLNETAAAHGLQLAETMAVGDGANDLAMIQAAGMGVAIHAKPIVAAAARARIDHGDLTALLYIQGYRRDEFAGG
ncbi:MAG: phosphoserine phosphatase SerB [Alphaproteobacteria bacterium]|nr:phosphoserine phosphatase SerB [Alphaproteobacteria bacterium]